MDVPLPTAVVSGFMVSKLPEFFDRFGISFTIDGPQLEYFVYEKKTGLDISCSLTVSFDETAGQISVMSFYPGLSLHPGTRYFSAVCFFMVMQHFANFYHIGSDCRISLNTKKEVFDTFYALLKDFGFYILLYGEKNLVDIESRFLSLAMDTSMINKRAPVDEYTD
jgi:hypothetical protein